MVPSNNSDEPHRLSRQQARRIAVRAQLLSGRLPADVLSVVRHLTMLQIDPTSAIAPNADLVLWSRLGSQYRPAQLVQALESGNLVELGNCIRPVEDVDLYRAEMAAWPGPEDPPTWRHTVRDWLVANESCRRDIVRRLERDGPLTSRELPDTCEVPWQSSGWTNNRNVTQMLEVMATCGQVAVAGRSGRERLWDLADRVYLDNQQIPAEQALGIRNERRLAALGIARERVSCHGEPLDVGLAGQAAVVDGVPGRWRVDPSLLTGRFTPRTVLLSPLDRLVFDRKRLAEIFEFDFQLEMYKPAARRRWGYFALPILSGDRFVGKLDATADRRAGLLRVTAIHHDVPFPAEVAAAVDQQIEALAAWLRLTRQDGAGDEQERGSTRRRSSGPNRTRFH